MEDGICWDKQPYMWPYMPYVCSLPKGHSGSHMAYDKDGIYASWRNADAEK